MVLIRNQNLVNEQPFTLIAGPCQIEGLDHARRHVEVLKTITSKLGIQFIYKSSFDKANRTSKNGRRGVGIDVGLDILARMREEFDVAVTTDVHAVDQVDLVSAYVDLLQVPAFLSRQTDLLCACGRTGLPVNIKKGQWMAPEDMKYAVDKVGHDNVMVTERGSAFGYHTLVVDMRSLVEMRDFAVTCFDATHSVQRPGIGAASGGDRRYVVPLAKAAVAIGVGAIFIECHEDPDHAPSDGLCMVPLSEMRAILKRLQLYDFVKGLPS